VAGGVVARLARPSGNITGFADFERPMGGKWLELLSEIMPGLKQAAIIFNPDMVTASLYRPSFETAARSLKVALIIAPIHSEVEIEMAVIALGREPGGGLVVVPDQFTIAPRPYRRRPETRSQRSTLFFPTPETGACSPMESTGQTSFVAPLPMSIAFCAARSRAISRCNCRRNTRWS